MGVIEIAESRCARRAKCVVDVNQSERRTGCAVRHWKTVASGDTADSTIRCRCFTRLLLIGQRHPLHRNVYLAGRKGLYCAFIDYKKAFHLINGGALWPKLISSGIDGKMFRVIHNIDLSATSCVKSNGMLSNYFSRQGENLSPLLFTLYTLSPTTIMVSVLYKRDWGQMNRIKMYMSF